MDVASVTTRRIGIRRSGSSANQRFCPGFTEEELDFALNYDTRLRQGFSGQVKYRLGRETETEKE